ncbi:DUF1376 domain-containing protein [Burkholderia plantarii]|uniref:DUF1376 domain-containing protein n=1 Tax=Burkholderia plantarii TaxID=41899 RepID=UPI000A830ACA|nr:DUF1376 domain-containing protein [Burkholderia plantarii]
MNDLPNPLTPADCDLTGYRWMPLDVVRVIDSDTFGLSTGDEFKTAFRLWAKSWLQVPAASLPEDDRLLAHLAGLDLQRWKKQRAIALRGWILCSDGRLYHPVIAEKAIEAMGKRDEHNEREHNQQTRQQRYRERRRELFELLRQRGIVPPAETKMPELERLAASLSASPSVTEGVTPVTHGDVTHDAPATAIDIDRTETRTKTVNPVVEASAGGTPRARPAELSAAMRRHSIEASPHDPRVIAAAERGLTPEAIGAACIEAKAAKPGERIGPAYVLAIAERWAADASRPRPARAGGNAESRQAFNDRENARAKEMLFGPEADHAA